MHCRTAQENRVREGIHVDDSKEICDSFAARWSEDRVFRIQYSDPGYGDTHPDQSKVFRSLEGAFKKVLSIVDIVAFCSPKERPTHR